MRNVGVRVAKEQAPQQLCAYTGFLMLVPRVWELLGHLDLPLCTNIGETSSEPPAIGNHSLSQPVPRLAGKK